MIFDAIVYSTSLTDESSGVETDPIVTATMVAGALALIEGIG